MAHHTESDAMIEARIDRIADLLLQRKSEASIKKEIIERAKEVKVNFPHELLKARERLHTENSLVEDARSLLNRFWSAGSIRTWLDEKYSVTGVSATRVVVAATQSRDEFVNASAKELKISCIEAMREVIRQTENDETRRKAICDLFRMMGLESIKVDVVHHDRREIDDVIRATVDRIIAGRNDPPRIGHDGNGRNGNGQENGMAS